jgi:hypothetical protein
MGVIETMDGQDGGKGLPTDYGSTQMRWINRGWGEPRRNEENLTAEIKDRKDKERSAE